MINYAFRNDPYKHPVLSEITDGVIFKEIVFLGVRFYISLDSNSNLVCIDDPLVIMLLMKNSKYRSLEIIFYSLELYEKQIPYSSVYSVFRNTVFYITNYLSQKKAKVVIFPSKLRLKYFESRVFLKNKSHVIYNKPEFSNIKLGGVNELARSWVLGQKNNGLHVVVFAGALVEGRYIDLIIDNLEDSGYSLLLAGKITGKKLRDKIEKSNRVLYLGSLERGEVFQLYKEVDFGLLSYSNKIKNSELCAPIKIWEYEYFGLKILGNENNALVKEWYPIIDGFYKDNTLNKAIGNSKKNNSLKYVPSMKKAFHSYIKGLM